jgi:signal transduction histidine kinase
MQTPDDASLQRELDRVERVFSDLRLLSDRGACERARVRAREAATGLPARADRSTDPAQAAMLALACELFVDAAPALDGDTGPIAQLVDRLQEALGLGRAQVAGELLGCPELASMPPAFASEALLALVDGGERRLIRLGFDLHDGPLQELLLLGEDLRLFREQLVDVLAEREEAALVRGRLDDLDARLIALEGGLRRISTAAHARVLLDRPFADVLADAIDAFTARAGIVPSSIVTGDPRVLSPSQRIALLSVVGEALNNIREHGRAASSVQVEISIGHAGVSACVVDDGCGFDVERALVDAARRGRMGLVGIHERVRLLGGRCVIDSRPGGPTTVSLSLPRWEPLQASAPAPAGAALSRQSG